MFSYLMCSRPAVRASSALLSLLRRFSCLFKGNKTLRLKVSFAYGTGGLGIVCSDACTGTQKLVTQIDFVFLLRASVMLKRAWHYARLVVGWLLQEAESESDPRHPSYILHLPSYMLAIASNVGFAFLLRASG